MADYVYVGRSRRRLKLGIYQVLTLGIHGRVWMYKLLREFDGHEALFLDRRPYVPLLILPIIGPFIVKRRIVALTAEIVKHDVTSPAFGRKRGLWLGLIPLLPFFHLYVQKVVNHHWRMHTKEEELNLKKAQLEQLQRRKSPEALAEAKDLSKDVAQRQKELDDLRSAAVALRDAEELRRQAEREGGVRRSRLDALRRVGAAIPLRRKAAAAEADETPGPEQETAAEQGPPPEPGEQRSERRPRRAPVDEEPEPQAPEPEPSPKGGLFRRLLPRQGPRSGSDGGETEAGLSKAEIGELRKKAKDERKAAKIAAKEERRLAKQRRKDEKNASKEARRAEKARIKAEKKAAKDDGAKSKDKGRSKANSDDKKPKSERGGKARPKRKK